MPTDIHSVDAKSLEVIIENIQRRITRYAEQGRNARGQDAQVFNNAVAALLTLQIDLKAILSEIRDVDAVSPQARREVENVLNDLLIELKTMGYNKTKNHNTQSGGTTDAQTDAVDESD